MHAATVRVLLWDDSSDDEGDQLEESLPLSWDAKEDVPKEDWDKLRTVNAVV